MRFCIEVASVNYREGAVVGFDELRHANILWQSSFKLAAELTAIAGKFEAKRSAEDNAVRLNTGSKGCEAEKNAFGNVCPSFATGDFRDAFAVFGVDGRGGGEILPFALFAEVSIAVVARLKILVFF